MRLSFLPLLFLSGLLVFALPPPSRAAEASAAVCGNTPREALDAAERALQFQDAKGQTLALQCVIHAISLLDDRQLKTARVSVIPDEKPEKR